MHWHVDWVREMPDIFEKDAGVMDLPGLRLIKDWHQRRKQEKQLEQAQEVIRQQAKNQQLVSFVYTNKNNETQRRSVEPYEIRDGYLWAVDTEKPEHVRRYIMDRIREAKPVNQSYDPRWDVKLASLGIGKKLHGLIRTPGVARTTEKLLGGGAGAYTGWVNTDPDDTQEEKAMRILGTGLLGAGAAHGLSLAVRRGLSRKEVEKAEEAIDSIVKNHPARVLLGRKDPYSRLVNKELREIVRENIAKDLPKILQHARQEGIVTNKATEDVFRIALRGDRLNASTLNRAQQVAYEAGRQQRANQFNLFRETLGQRYRKVLRRDFNDMNQAIGDIQNTAVQNADLINRKLFGAF